MTTTAKPKDVRTTYVDATTVQLDCRVDNLTNELADGWNELRVETASAEAGPYSYSAGLSQSLVAGTNAYSATDSSGSEDTWYRIYLHKTGGPTDGTKVGPVVGSGGGRYLTVQDLRTYGWTVAQLTNAAARLAIAEGEAHLEHLTRRRFYAEQKTITVDGNDSEILPIEEPIIEVSAIQVLSVWAEIGSVYDDIDLDTVRVSNRHLTRGVYDPDDRDAPSLRFVVFEHYSEGMRRRQDNWFDGAHNVALQGWYGFTELEPGETAGETTAGSQLPLSRGRTPLLVKRAAMLLAARMMPTPASADDYEDATRAWQVERYKTRDQEILYSKQTMTRGDFTGDPDVDRFISMFAANTFEVAFV